MFFEWNDEKYLQRLSKRVHDGLDTSVKTALIAAGNSYGYKLIDIDKRGNKGIIHLSPLVPKAGLVRNDAGVRLSGGAKRRHLS